MNFSIKRWHWIVLGVVVYLTFLIAYIPAIYVASIVEKQSNGEVRLYNVSGTLFEGNASVLEAKGVRINNLDWTLSPWALLIARASLDIQGGAMRDAEQIYIDTDASIKLFSPEHFTLSDTTLLVPAKSALSQFALPIAVTAEGRFRLDLEKLKMHPQCTDLQGKGAWLNAEIDMPQRAVNLGSFEANMSCADGAFTVQVLPENSLQLKADIVVDATGDYSIDGTFKPDDSLPQDIQLGAESFFSKNEQGFYIISL